MSVHEQLVIMYGVDIGYDKYEEVQGNDWESENYKFFEKFDDKFRDCKIDGISIVSDGMSGEYCIIGKIIYLSPRYDPIEDFGILEIRDIPTGVENEIRDFIKDNFGIEKIEIKKLVFMHYE